MERLQEQLASTKAMLEQERKLNKELRCEKVNYASDRNELEEFFLECIDAVKCDISKRKE